MIIHRYDSYNKFYTYTEEVNERFTGVDLPLTTVLAPPLNECTYGEIPVFKDGSWQIVEDVFWHPKYININYDAGRNLDTFKIIEPIMQDFMKFPSLSQICNTRSSETRIHQSLLFINEKFIYCIDLYNLVRNGLGNNVIYSPLHGNKPYPLLTIYKFKTELESMVFNMRRILDTLIQLTDIMINLKSFEKRKKIEFNSIGSLIYNKKKKKDSAVIDIIFGSDLYEVDSTNFLNIINDLANSFKHTLMHDESFNLIGDNYPTILTYYTTNNDYSKVIQIHNHNVYHIMMGFQDCISRIYRNQEIYRQNNSIKK